MDELERRLAASRDRLRGRITPPPADDLITRARRRRTQRRAQIAVVGLVAALAVAVPVASQFGGQHRAGPASQPPARTTLTIPTTVTVTDTPSTTPSTRGSHPSASESTSGGVPGESSAADGSTGASLAPVTAPTTVTAGQPILDISGGYELFARSPESVARIQFAQGKVTVKPAPAIQSGAGAFFLAGQHAVIARPWDYVPGFLMPDDGPARKLPGVLAGGGGSTLPGTTADHVWVESTTNGTESGVDALHLVGFDGKKTGTSIPMSGPALAPDGHGYVLVQGADCLYDVQPDGRACIASGGAVDLVALGPTGWVVRPCADGKRCKDVYIDRATGSQRQLSVDVDPQQWGVISPDGSYAAILDSASNDSGTTTLHLVDLSAGSGRVVTLASNSVSTWPSHGATMAWSPDGRWLFVAAGRILAVDPGTGQSQALSVVPGNADFIQVAIRPARADRTGS